MKVAGIATHTAPHLGRPIPSGDVLTAGDCFSRPRCATCTQHRPPRVCGLRGRCTADRLPHNAHSRIHMHQLLPRCMLPSHLCNAHAYPTRYAHEPALTPYSSGIGESRRVLASARLASTLSTRVVHIVHLGVPARPTAATLAAVAVRLVSCYCRIARLSRDAYLLLQSLRLAHPCFEALWHCRLGNAATEF
jgi:hypothetical protein